MRFRDYLENYSILNDPEGMFKPGFSYDIKQYVDNIAFRNKGKAHRIASSMANDVESLFRGDASKFNRLVQDAETWPAIWNDIMVPPKYHDIKKAVDQAVASKNRPAWKKVLGMS